MTNYNSVQNKISFKLNLRDKLAIVKCSFLFLIDALNGETLTLHPKLTALLLVFPISSCGVAFNHNTCVIRIYFQFFSFFFRYSLAIYLETKVINGKIFDDLIIEQNKNFAIKIF